jgi:Lamin Tail Domain
MKKFTVLLSTGAIAVTMAALTPALAASAASTTPTLSAAPAVSAAAAAARRPIVISEIFYNSPGSDRGGNRSLNAEWVKLHNRSGRAVSLTGWTLRDTAHHVFTFGSYRLRAHGFVKIHTGHGRATRANRFWNHSWYIWNNTGDKATLRTATGAFRARCKYSDPREEFSHTFC